MIKYFLSDYYWLYFYAIIGWGILFILILFFFNLKKSYRVHRSKLIYLYLISISFSFLGLSIGLLIGSSVSPVIGIVIPALLTFLGGFITYVFIFAKKNKEDGLIMIIVLISLSFFLILGSDYSTSMRIRALKLISDEEDLKVKEFEIFKYKLSKGLINEQINNSFLKDKDQQTIDTVPMTKIIKDK